MRGQNQAHGGAGNKSTKGTVGFLGPQWGRANQGQSGSRIYWAGETEVYFFGGG